MGRGPRNDGAGAAAHRHGGWALRGPTSGREEDQILVDSFMWISIGYRGISGYRILSPGDARRGRGGLEPRGRKSVPPLARRTHSRPLLPLLWRPITQPPGRTRAQGRHCAPGRPHPVLL
eukprot:scaffold2539_cov388-Prasinococcus_capsulatus_cf.AAC.13